MTESSSSAGICINDYLKTNLYFTDTLKHDDSYDEYSLHCVDVGDEGKRHDISNITHIVWW